MSSQNFPASSWRGVFPSLQTAFTPDGEVDLDGVHAITEFVLDAGAHGVVTLGLAGEVEMLSIDERLQVADTIVRAVDGRVPVLVGATGESLSASLKLAAHAQQIGAAGIVLPLPTGVELDRQEVADYFVAVASSVSLPVVVQDAPEFLTGAVAPDVVAKAARRAPNIRVVKLETGPEGIDRWRDALGSDVLVFAGSGGLHMLDVLDAGAVGVMPASDLTDRLVEIYTARERGDTDQAQNLFASLLPMIAFEMQGMRHGNRCAKHLLARRGLAIDTGVRAPGQRYLDGSSVRRLEQHAAFAGIPLTRDVAEVIPAAS